MNKTRKNISIIIDNWDDIFSDFDPRPLGDRLLSEDFVSELKKRYREARRDTFSVTICAPIALRDDNAEKMVIQRLKRDFKYQYLQRRKDLRSIRTKGAIFVLFGVTNLAALTIITYFKLLNELHIALLGIVLMPLGWFGIWEGFSKLVDTAPKHFQEEKFYEKFSEASYKFEYLEDIV